MSKPRILHVAFSDLGRNGVARVIMDICENVDGFTHDVLVMGPNDGDHTSAFLSRGGKIFHFIAYRGNKHLKQTLAWYFIPIKLFFKTTSILKKHGKYEAVHCHNLFESGSCIAAAFLAGVKIRIVHSHMSKYLGWQSLFRRVVLGTQKAVLRKISTHRVACSDSAGEYLFGKKTNYEMIPNGVELSAFDFRKHKHSIQGDIRFVHIGRFSPQKNQLFMLEVFSKLCGSFPKISLNIIGSGIMKENIEKKIIELGIENMVTMHPAEADIPAILAESDFMIFPSIHEGMAITLIEAQAMGVYCFATDGLTKASDIGLLEFVSLEKGSDYWAGKITEFVNKEKSVKARVPDEEKLDGLNIKKISVKYSKIYKMNKRSTDVT